MLKGSDAAGTIYRSGTMTFRTPAIGGDLASERSSAGDGDEAWIEVDLAETREVRAIAFRSREMTDGSAVTTCFTVTIDGSVFGPFRTGSTPSELDQPVAGRMLRFDDGRQHGRHRNRDLRSAVTGVVT